MGTLNLFNSKNLFTVFIGVSLLLLQPNVLRLGAQTVTVTIPDTSALPNELVMIPLNISDVTGLGIIAADIILTFDPDLLAASDASLGSVVPSGWLIVSNPEMGKIIIALAGSNPLVGNGTLVEIPFTVLPTAPPCETCVIHFANMQFNEGTPKADPMDGNFYVGSTGIGSLWETTPLPENFSLAQCYPNPFLEETKISYELKTLKNPSKLHQVKLQIYNLEGELIRTLVDKPEPPGYYIVPWDGKDSRGNQVSSGVYLYQLKAGNYSSTRKVLVLR